MGLLSTELAENCRETRRKHGKPGPAGTQDRVAAHAAEGPPSPLTPRRESRGHDVWGDAGVLYWLIRPEDLAERPFERAMFTWRCS
ncbi:DUF1963 domain-containing protein [Streptomyces cyaneofuscatus]|uniref:DUF1963 domain-containing protein n=1 Tax=Streptomyces cyaneofuscatus TaxID=66883 RepID=UPI0033BF7478